MYSLNILTKGVASAALALCLSTAAQAQTIYGLADGNLVTIDASNPFGTGAGTAITGVTSGQVLMGLDSRPATGQLFALGHNPNTGESRLYVINPSTAVASPVGAAAITLLLGNGGVGFDFNPTVDRIRVTGRNGRNYRLNPNNGALAATDGNLFYAPGDRFAGTDPMVSAVAYTNSYIGSTNTTLYDVDDAVAALSTQNPPNNGQLNSVTAARVSLTPGFEDLDISYDKAEMKNKAWAVRSTSLGSFLLKLDLATGNVDDLGLMPGRNVTDIAAAISVPPVGPVQGYVVWGLGLNGSLLSWDSENPSVIRSQVTITGIPAVMLLAGMDVRPATGQLYILGYNRGGMQARLYVVDPATGVATQMGQPFQADLGSTRNIGFDFNPTVDRIRIVSTNNLNLRVHPETGAIAATDGSLAYAAGDVNAGRNPAVGTGAYTNSFSGSTATTLYTFDDSTNSLNTQLPPNNGTQNTVGAAGFNFATSDGGVDMDVVSDGQGGNWAFATGRPNSDMWTSFFRINVTTGAFTKVGMIGNGVLVRDIAIQGTASAPTARRGVEADVQAVGIFPNPAAATVRLTYTQDSDAEATVTVIDALGRRVKRATLGGGTGAHNERLDVSALRAGTYQVRIESNGKTIAEGRLVK